MSQRLMPLVVDINALVVVVCVVAVVENEILPKAAVRRGERVECA